MHMTRLDYRRWASVGMACCLALAAGSPAFGQDLVKVPDPARKGMFLDRSGWILEENDMQILLRPNIGPNLVIPTTDVIDVVYEVKPALRPDYRRAAVAEAEAAKAREGSPERRAALSDARKRYEELLPKIADNKSLQRHLQYKVILLSAQLAGDDAERKQAVALLEGFIKDFPQCWQVHSARVRLCPLVIALPEQEPLPKEWSGYGFVVLPRYKYSIILSLVRGPDNVLSGTIVYDLGFAGSSLN